MLTHMRRFFWLRCYSRLALATLCPLPLLVWFVAGNSSAAQPNCAPRPNGLIAWYRGEGNGLDSVGTNHGTLNNGVGFTTGKVMQAFSFNGAGELTVPNAPALNPAHLTIETWIYPTQLDGGVDVIVNKDFDPYGGFQYEIGIRGPNAPGGSIPAGNFAFALRGVNGLPDDYLSWVNGDGAIPLNTWTHVALTYDGSTARTYINGLPRRSLTGLSGDVTGDSGPLRIGSRSEDVLGRSPKERFNGRIDEVSLYNRALTEAEILAIFNAGSVGKCPTQNALPTITAAPPLTRQQGNPGNSATLATVSDLETSAGNLTVTATTVPAGLTITNISNANGTITATVAATCTATVGAQTVVLTVTDSVGGTATANLAVNVTANTPPVLGPYPSTNLALNQTSTVSPNVAPSDNGILVSVSAAVSAGFTGTVAVNATTGVVTINNPAPGGAYVVTVSATDNCGVTTNSAFNLTVGKLNSTTQLAVSAGPYLLGQAITLTATVIVNGAGAPTGTVTFLAGTTSLGTATLNASGQAIFVTSTLPAGTHTLTAMYAGDGKYGPSSSTSVTILIARSVANVSAASYLGAQFAREEIIAAFGANLATRNQAAAALPLPITLAGTTVSVKDSTGVERPAPLFFVSPNQINYLMPAETALGQATVTITSGNPENVARAVLQIAPVAPGIFSGNANGAGVAAAHILRVQPDGRQQYEPVLRLDPATKRFVPIAIEFGPPSEQLFLLLYCTGLRYRSSLNNVTAAVGTVTVPVSFAGAQGSLAGLDQVNLRLMPNLSTFPNPTVSLNVDGAVSNSVQISFR